METTRIYEELSEEATGFLPILTEMISKSIGNKEQCSGLKITIDVENNRVLVSYTKKLYNEDGSPKESALISKTYEVKDIPASGMVDVDPATGNYLMDTYVRDTEEVLKTTTWEAQLGPVLRPAIVATINEIEGYTSE